MEFWGGGVVVLWFFFWLVVVFPCSQSEMVFQRGTWEERLWLGYESSLSLGIFWLSNFFSVWNVIKAWLCFWKHTNKPLFLLLLSDHSAPPSSFLPYLYLPLSAVTPRLRKSSSFSADRPCHSTTCNKTVEKSSNYSLACLLYFSPVGLCEQDTKNTCYEFWKIQSDWCTQWLSLLVVWSVFCNISSECVCVVKHCWEHANFSVTYKNGFLSSFPCSVWRTQLLDTIRKNKDLYPKDGPLLLCWARKGCLWLINWIKI